VITVLKLPITKPDGRNLLNSVPAFAIIPKLAIVTLTLFRKKIRDAS
jgi:hypothetical protein